MWQFWQRRMTPSETVMSVVQDPEKLKQAKVSLMLEVADLINGIQPIECIGKWNKGEEEHGGFTDETFTAFNFIGAKREEVIDLLNYHICQLVQIANSSPDTE